VPVHSDPSAQGLGKQRERPGDALDSATISERVTSRCLCSMRCRVDLPIPANPAMTRNGLSRALRMLRMRQPIMRVTSIAAPLFTRAGLR